MKYLHILSLIILAFALTLLDAAFFSFISLSGITIIFSYLVAVIFALIGKPKNLLTITLVFVVSFSIFTSLPVWAIITCFFILPSLLYYLRSAYFPEPSVFASAIFFTLATCLFELILLLQAGEWNHNGFTSLGFFTLYNTLAGVTTFFIVKRIARRFSRGEIRI